VAIVPRLLLFVRVDVIDNTFVLTGKANRFLHHGRRSTAAPALASAAASTTLSGSRALDATGTDTVAQGLQVQCRCEDGWS